MEAWNALDKCVGFSYNAWFFLSVSTWCVCERESVEVLDDNIDEKIPPSKSFSST